MSRDFQDSEGNIINVMAVGLGNREILFNGVAVETETICEIMKYLMIIMDLGKNDPRKRFRGWIKKLRIGPGWNKGGRRYIRP